LRILRRLLSWALCLGFCNSLLLLVSLPAAPPLRLGFALLLGLAFALFQAFPRKREAWPARLQALANGYELLLAGGALFLGETLLYAGLLFRGAVSPLEWANLGLCLLLTLVPVLGGLLRVGAVSREMGLVLRILLLLLWWLPILNLALVLIAAFRARREFLFSLRALRRDEQRAAERICATRYPILLVHGIFFRDWPLFNYWGRIPQALAANGATLFYGGQAASAPIEKSAAQLKARILEVLAQTGSEKLNIIAHSRGGLEARYAIGRLGLGDQVASLTTISTPHLGCGYLGPVLERTPSGLKALIQRGHNAAFRRLGDPEPDFFGAVKDLSAEACRALNEAMPDAPGVLYQSVGSRMAGARASHFPLNLGYGLIKPLEGDNDGLVPVHSMAWGHFLGVLSPKGRKGLSHGDMIDLTRKIIPGFDVCEFYVGLVSGLKARGL
jgi:triacylglycerol lipase